MARGTTASEGGRHRVLVVDDNAAARYSTARVLQAAGFDTIESAGGAEALELARGTSAVVLDVHLPDLHGFEVCRLLRAQPETATLPVIHVSAVYVEVADRIAGIGTGADAYMLSPVEPPLLVATIQALVRARGATEALRRSEARMRGIFQQARSAIALVDAAGVLDEVNPAFTTLLQRPAEALVGRPLSDFAPRGGGPAVQSCVAAWNAGPWQGSFALVLGDGRTIELGWSVTPHVEPGFHVAVATPVAQPGLPGRV